MKTLAILSALLLSACAGPKLPQWAPLTEDAKREYAPYLAEGSATLKGQAFLTQRGGGVVKAAGRVVTLDPATSIGRDWWQKAGRTYAMAYRRPPVSEFNEARRTATADADGRFKFSKLPPGRYYVRTEVTWEVGGYTPTQGGALGRLVEIPEAGDIDIVLSDFTQ